MIRYVHKGRFALGRPAECQLCGTRAGLTTLEPYNVCDATICLNCGTRQCMVNGLGHGACGICLVGLLLGWSGNDRRCGKSGCNARAVADAPRIHYACREHAFADRNLLDRRTTQFVPYDDARWRYRQDWSRDFDYDSVRLFVATDTHVRAVEDAKTAEQKRLRDERWRGAIV